MRPPTPFQEGSASDIFIIFVQTIYIIWKRKSKYHSRRMLIGS